MASWISRVRLEVSTTIGGSVALTVPISGIVIWKSDSTSRRYASNGSSVRSSSSISSTGAAPGAPSSACISGRLTRKRSEKMSLATASRVAPCDLGLADARFAFEKQRPAHLESEENRRRETALGDVGGARKQGERVVDRLREGAHPRIMPARSRKRIKSPPPRDLGEGRRGSPSRRSTLE